MMFQKSKPYGMALLGGGTGAAILAFLFQGAWFSAWVPASLLLTTAFILLYLVWVSMGRDRMVAWMVALAFGLRLVTGVGMSLALPVLGYPEPCQKEGYLFKDACRRDQESFAIAHTGDTLFYGSGIRLDSDQYGGLAFFSAWIYRYLSPDAHRPYLVLIAGAFFAALGVPFFYSGLIKRWSGRVALFAAWLYVLYPDAVFFGSSQMREPFLVGLSAIALWGSLTVKDQLPSRLAVVVLSVAGMAFFSPRIAAVEAAALVVLIWMDTMFNRSDNFGKLLGWLGLLAGGGLLLVVSWSWMRSSSGWDVLVTIRQSGWVEKIIHDSGDDRFIYPIIAVYGLAQPVLPAAITDTNALPIWRVIAIIRSLGWYLLAPFLLYGLLVMNGEKDPGRRHLLIWLGVVTVAWLLIAAIRGGGDLTDNPRYRSLFIPWMALLAGWAADLAITQRSPILWRVLAVESIFLTCFMSWYSARYFHVGIKLPFWEMVGIIICLSTVLLAPIRIKVPQISPASQLRRWVESQRIVKRQ